VINIDGSCCDLAATNAVLVVFGAPTIVDLPCNTPGSLTLALKELLLDWANFDRAALPRLGNVVNIIDANRVEALRNYCDFITGCHFGGEDARFTENEVHLSYYVLVYTLRKEHHLSIEHDTATYDGTCSCPFCMCAVVTSRYPRCCSSRR
jgi:hypothetical protein